MHLDKKVIKYFEGKRKFFIDCLKTMDIKDILNGRIILKLIEILISKTDERIFRHRDKDLYRVKEIRTRKISLPHYTPEYGWTSNTFMVKRRIYTNIKTNKLCYLVDKELGLPKKKRYIDLNVKRLMEAVLNSYSYKKAIKNLDLDISDREVTEVIRESRIYVKPKKFLKPTQTITATIDGQHHTTNARRKIIKVNGKVKLTRPKKEFKTVKLSSGRIKISKEKAEERRRELTLLQKEDPANATLYRALMPKRRYELLNVTLLSFPSEFSSRQIAIAIENHLKAYYTGVKEINLVGDAASWICNTGNHISIPTKRYLDFFHFTQELRKFLGKRNTKDFNVDEWMNSSLGKFQTKVCFAKGNRFVTEKGEANITYLENTAEGAWLTNWFGNCRDGIRAGVISSIEGVHGKQYKLIFKTTRKFSRDVHDKLLFMKNAEISNWDIEVNPENPGSGYIAMENIYNLHRREIKLSDVSLEDGYSNDGITIKPFTQHNK